MGNTRRLRIDRLGHAADMLRSYEIIVNEELAGEIKRNGVLEIAVPTEPFTVMAAIDWCSSRPVEVPAGDAPLTMQVANKHGIWKARWAMENAANDYLSLEFVYVPEPEPEPESDPEDEGGDAPADGE